MKRTISIIGPIGGDFTYKGKKIQGVTLADVVAQVVALPKDTTELIVEFDTPGGLVPVGQSIYNYLRSMAHRFEKGITSKQIGDIGSIGTVAWFAGTKRIAARGINPETGQPYKFMIHNPFMLDAEGDSDAMKKHADSLKITEDEMADFYVSQTGITKEGIVPLMKAETDFDGDKAVQLKFATDIYEPQKIAAVHTSKTSNQHNHMSKETEKSIMDQILAIFRKSAVVAVAPPAELMGKAVLVDNKPAVDGVYTVVGGVVTALAEAQAAPAAAPAPGAPAADPMAANLSEVLFAAAVKKATEAKDAEIIALKKTIKTEHVPVGFTPETKGDDIKEWDRSFKANEHFAMKKNDPEKYQRLFYAKYGKLPNM